MINAFYASKSGVNNYQSYLDAIANNIANASTDSYKAQVVSFTDLLYSNVQAPDGDPQNIQVGNGSRILVSKDMTQGAITTGNAGIMINGSGFYAVENENGDVLYTRKGDFLVREIEGSNYLVNQNGDFVLDSDLNRVVLNQSNYFNLSAPGEATANSTVVGIFQIQNPEDLIAVGNGKYMISPDAAAAPTIDTDSELVYDLIESSNVDLITEMSKMIIAQRGFQLNARMIQTVDELESYANNLRN